MCRKLTFLLFAVSLLALANSTLGFPLRVDIGDTGQPVKAGWEEFTGNHNDEDDPKTESYDVNGLSISMSVQTGVDNDSGYRDYGGGDLGGDMVYPDSFDGPANGRVILTLGNLPAGSYMLTSYHNDTKGSHAQQDPIDVTVGGAISGSVSDLGVIQTKSLDDANLGNSTVTFTANGAGDVVVTYTPTTNNGIVSKAVLNGFDLDLLGAVPSEVEFNLSSSSDFESVSLVILAVELSPATPNTVTVDYNVTGGTATVGQDYTFSAGMLTFDPNQTTPEYISISIINDGQPEDDETIEVTLSNPVNALLGTNTQHTYTILDPSPRVGYETTDSEGSEDVSPAYIPVSLSWAWSETVTVDYNVTGGTAIGGEDYNLPAGTLSFDPCELTQYISIGIVDDDFDEDPDETIEITLSNPSNAKLGPNTVHAFTILPSPARICPEGDLDGDCEIDFNDLEIFAGQWLDPPESCSGPNCANLNGSNVVNMLDYALLAENWREEICPLVINEFMASNGGFLTDPCDPNETPDWFELYNASAFPLDLSGMYLTDDLDDPTQYEIPAGVTIPAYGYLLFYADNDDGEDPLRTNFALGGGGEEIGLGPQCRCIPWRGR
jgi:hypothetical protein